MPSPIHIVAIIAGGGRGYRLGLERPKPLVDLGGRSILERSLAAFLASDRVHEVIVALPRDLAVDPPACLKRCSKPLQVVVGGERRQDSVANAFDRVSQAADVVLVHDAARPFVSVGLIGRTIDAAIESGAAVAAVPVRDTVKRADRGSGMANGGRSVWPVVTDTLPRDAIFLAQTPQAFRRKVLEDAIALGRRGAEATDEAGLAEQAGHAVRLVEGEAWNLKITTPEDLTMARALVSLEDQRSVVAPARVGTGYDLHRLVEGRPLILGGVSIPFPRGPAGHSDGDALSHAVTDAILGAATAGDIGMHFPDTDARWQGASSLDLLRRAAAIVREAGFAVENVDAVVVVERPRLVPYLDTIRTKLAEALGIDRRAVSVKGKTNEGLDAIGRGEAVAVHAVALLRTLAPRTPGAREG